MNRLFIFNVDRVISFLRLGSKHFLPDFSYKSVDKTSYDKKGVLLNQHNLH